MASVKTDEFSAPKSRIKIVQCGSEDVPKPFCLNKSQIESDTDIDDVEIVV